MLCAEPKWDLSLCSMYAADLPLPCHSEARRAVGISSSGCAAQFVTGDCHVAQALLAMTVVVRTWLRRFEHLDKLKFGRRMGNVRSIRGGEEAGNKKMGQKAP